MADEETRLVACLRTDRPDMIVTVGSERGRCERCGAEVWVAESTREMKAPKVIACIECCQPELEKAIAGQMEIEPISRDQALEIVATLGSRGEG